MKRKKRRRRLPDTRPAPSQANRIAPLPGETYRERHARRLAQAATDEAELSAWCTPRGLTLKVANKGHHWMITYRDRYSVKALAEWWPSSAKLVIRQRWRAGIHCHDITQLQAALVAECPELANPRTSDNGQATQEDRPSPGPAAPARLTTAGAPGFAPWEAATLDDDYRGGELPPAGPGADRIGHGIASGRPD